jgi:hypothetical protein
MVALFDPNTITPMSDKISTYEELPCLTWGMELSKLEDLIARARKAVPMSTVVELLNEIIRLQHGLDAIHLAETGVDFHAMPPSTASNSLDHERKIPPVGCNGNYEYTGHPH